MKNTNTLKIEKLIQKGVQIPNPDSIQISKEVDPDKISGEGVVIHAGCKILGESTVILHGVQLGYEGPATVENCQIGPLVKLKGGFFKDAVFLAKVKMGLGSHVREGTILEEEASVAHTVALKQTILFPFVTLGSLINFCDCFMSGGTSRKDHSEVGSSYIHFNFTPNQDKATPSLIGDVPKGVMLNQRPIFLGGQGGLVGPCRLAYGTTIAAGTICRKDELRPDRLIFGGVGKGGNIPYTPGQHLNNKMILANNIIYIANLFTLLQWYKHVRSLFISENFPQFLLDALKEKLNMAINERIMRLVDFCQKIQTYDTPKEKASSARFNPKLEAYLKTQKDREGDTALMDNFLEKIYLGINNSKKDYITVIKGLPKEDAEQGTRWLQGIVDEITTGALAILR
jgi:UDP-N-acetylglucosamine/UDP-N-acetylgalactosamine diphosphorylase